MKTKKILSLSVVFCCLMSLIHVNAQTAQNRTSSKPKLVVGIVVDQMRWDYLYRFSNRYGAGGFKRLLNEGFSCENAMINYVPSYTAIGHTTVYTGSVPSIHGIAGNEFIIQATGKSMYCTEDTTVSSVGNGDKNSPRGKMSPFNLKATTITDELKLATNFKSKVIGVAIKDRGAILPAGHAANAAYWYDGATGNFITSTFYMNELPKWLVDFNNKKMPEQYLKKDWNTLYPIETYTLSFKDKNNYEKPLDGGTENTQFPIKTSELMKKSGMGLISTTPYGSTLTLDVAKEAVTNEQMGQHESTDFLAISLSSPDYVGHQFSINSVKIEDNYLRLDKDLSDFFSFLDLKVGKGNYMLYITADHGASHNAQFSLDNKIPAGVFVEKTVRDSLNKHLAAKFGVNDLVLSLNNYQVNFNYKNVKAVDKKQLIDACIDYFKQQPNVAYVVETSKVAEAAIPEKIKEKIINGYNRELCGEIQVILKPGWYSDSSMKGGTHGAWNPYDAHIPLVWMGWGIKHGQSNQEVYMTDIAPTVAALLHIQMPNGCIGKPILPVLGQ